MSVVGKDYARRTEYYGPYKKLDSPNNNESWFGQGYTFPLYDQYLQYGRNYVPPCSLGNRRRGRRGYPVTLLTSPNGLFIFPFLRVFFLFTSHVIGREDYFFLIQQI
jgi:hypothetical protein